MADQFEMTGRDDQRHSERKPARVRVWADPGGVVAATDCTVVDISKDGARVAHASNTILPDRFSLLQDGNTKMADVEVVWRSNGFTGVKFVDAKKA